MADYQKLIGQDQFSKVLEQYQRKELPAIETDALLRIWAEGWPETVRKLAKADGLIQALRAEKEGLFAAKELRLNNNHLGQAERLQTAGVNLRLSSK